MVVADSPNPCVVVASTEATVVVVADSPDPWVVVTSAAVDFVVAAAESPESPVDVFAVVVVVCGTVVVVVVVVVLSIRQRSSLVYVLEGIVIDNYKTITVIVNIIITVIICTIVESQLLLMFI